MSGPLPADWYARPVLDVARDLLGCLVVHDSAEGRVAVRLSEVEAYAGQADPGSHAYRGPTRRTAVMFGPPGHAYVYFSYGMHWCMNLVCRPEGTASAVLLRAGEVVEGLDLARTRRAGARDRDLARGPARLTRALGISGGLDGSPVTAADGPLRVCAGTPVPTAAIRSGPRVGVAGAGSTQPWRFWVDGDPSVSIYRPAVARRRARRAPDS